MTSALDQKGLIAAAETYFAESFKKTPTEAMAAAISAYLSTVIPAEIPEVVEKLRNRGGQVLLEGGYSDPPEPDWLLLNAATLIERLAASQAEKEG